MINFLEMEISLPKVGNSSVKEAGSYSCKLNQDSTVLTNDREDISESPTLKERTEEFQAPWIDPTLQILQRFDTEDGRIITDRFQLGGYEHYDSENPASAEQKKAWTAFFAKHGETIKSYAKVEHRGTCYICGKTASGELIRVPSAENTLKSLRRLVSAMKLAGIELEGNLKPAEIVDTIKSATGLKNLIVNLEEKEFTGERRSTSKLFKVSYGERKEKVTKASAVSQDI